MKTHLQASEYSAASQQLTAVHEEIIAQLKVIQDDLGNIVIGSFQAREVSPKVQALLSSLDHDLIGYLDQLFHQSEDSIKQFGNTMINCDTTC